MVQYRPQKRARVQEHHAVATLGKPGCPADFEGPFRSNIRSFLHDFARGPQSTSPVLSLPGVRSWSLPLRSDAGFALSLYILEESPLLSQSLYCDRCRVLGWSHHPVCQRRYHFIIGSAELEESTGVGKGRKLCLGCNRVIPASTKTCPACGSDATKSKVLEARTHLLHGVIHSNGFGHLLRVNGREGGSQSLSGREIMDLWDRLCIMLRARKVSVMDVSKKHHLEFRLSHAVAHGFPWYGMWGYTFGWGCFCIPESLYCQAIDLISSASLTSVLSTDKKLKSIASVYQGLSKTVLVVVRDLIRFMMELLTKLRRESRADQGRGSLAERAVNQSVSEGGACRWPAKRLEQAQEALLKVLRGSEKAMWLSRQILREGARSHIGDTGLLDFVLKGFVDKVVDQEIVRRRVNTRTRMLEYRLEDLECRSSEHDIHHQDQDHSAVVVPDQPKYEEVVQDFTFLYHALLESYKPVPLPNAAQIVLDVKQFIKDYQGEFTRDRHELNVNKSSVHEDPFRVLCIVDFKDKGGRDIPAELVVLPRDATFGDLKQNVAKAFRDLYLCFDRFEVVSIPGMDGIDDDQKLATYFRETQFTTTVHGTGVDDSAPGRYERGTDEWVVDCACGTRDDDGERMACCDSCGIWHHTRCAGIADSDPVPHDGFLCKRCTSSCGTGLLS